ncbi:MinD-like ATPase involved in chromosome partitioning or flagellar assembly [Streptacidiphilus sp. MAP12-20]|uniref:MinD/ParA family ATP-binding protein n=1 Tax=Streptacidiphilus sp. MAP12-20 TaxID=3156299 RepID=UPI003511EAE3
MSGQARIVVVHSFRGGTGKSTVVANLAQLLAQAGAKVAMVDTDLHSPTLQALFGLPADGLSLGDYLLGRCEIEAAARPVGPPGLTLVPARTASCPLAQILATGYDVGLLPEGFHRLIERQSLDVLLLDTHTGLNNETVTAMACADVLVTVVRADLVDLPGTEEAKAMAHRLDCARALVVNMVATEEDPQQACERAERAHGIAALPLPYALEMSQLAGTRIFSEARPKHSLATGFRRLANTVLD